MSKGRIALLWILSLIASNGWWAFARWPDVGDSVLVLLPGLATLGLVALAIDYIIDNWSNK
jgi:hypothetical protein